MDMTQIHAAIQWANGHLWDWLIILLLGTGVYFTLATRFIQIRLFGRSVKEMLSGRKSSTDPHGITPFQAFIVGLASRVGVGNIAGVAIAISVGGAGAVFWMCVTALVGMSSAFAESSLAQLFKVRDKENKQFRGGPAYYITQGLKQHWLGVLFALSLILCFGFVFNAVQANTIAAAAETSWAWNKQMVGIGLVILTAPIIFGGIRRVSKFAEAVVPVMAVLYLAMALYIVLTNLGAVPAVVSLIFSKAFQFDAAAGGFFGAMVSQAMMMGIKRGLYSNEAGMGSAPNAAAAAEVSHPASQGMIQMLGVFVDTIIVCSCTAFILLLSDVQNTTDLTGAQLTQAALVHHVGAWGADFLTIILFLFAFSTVVGNYAYAESNIQFIKSNRIIMNIFRMVVLMFVYFGAIWDVPLVWDMADLSMGIMAVINLIAILLLSPMVLLLMKDYQAKVRLGKTPEFKLSEHPVLKRKIKSDIW